MFSTYTQKQKKRKIEVFAFECRIQVKNSPQIRLLYSFVKTQKPCGFVRAKGFIFFMTVNNLFARV